jgi:hypothetical protein
LVAASSSAAVVARILGGEETNHNNGGAESIAHRCVDRFHATWAVSCDPAAILDACAGITGEPSRVIERALMTGPRGGTMAGASNVAAVIRKRLEEADREELASARRLEAMRGPRPSPWADVDETGTAIRRAEGGA